MSYNIDDDPNVVRIAPDTPVPSAIEASKTLFTEGAVVELNSGGPPMTVERIMPPEDDCVCVAWFAGSTLHRDRFHVLDLHLAAPKFYRS